MRRTTANALRKPTTVTQIGGAWNLEAGRPSLISILCPASIQLSVAIACTAFRRQSPSHGVGSRELASMRSSLASK
jgi:hypothetical protein